MSDDNVIKLGGKSRGKLRGKSDGNNKNEEVCCSFCGRSNEEVLKMVKGAGVNICFRVCNDCGTVPDFAG